MIWMVIFIALMTGTDAATKLNSNHPKPVAWFEAAVTLVLIVIAAVIWIIDEYGDRWRRR